MLTRGAATLRTHESVSTLAFESREHCPAFLRACTSRAGGTQSAPPRALSSPTLLENHPRSPLPLPSEPNSPPGLVGRPSKDRKAPRGVIIPRAPEKGHLQRLLLRGAASLAARKPSPLGAPRAGRGAPGRGEGTPPIFARDKDHEKQRRHTHTLTHTKSEANTDTCCNLKPNSPAGVALDRC